MPNNRLQSKYFELINTWKASFLQQLVVYASSQQKNLRSMAQGLTSLGFSFVRNGGPPWVILPL